MTWTKTPPTEPGTYWYHDVAEELYGPAGRGPETSLVLVWKNYGGGGELHYTDGNCTDYMDRLSTLTKGWFWSEPLIEPPPPKEGE